MAFEELKDRIKETPVSMVIGNYMALSKKGANLEGICPFHPDTKPSLKVNDSKGMYKCFVCGNGGDSIKFVQEFKRVDFVEALKAIADLLGLPFEEKEKKKNPKIEMALRVISASVKLYKKVSTQDPSHFVEFVTKRKLNSESLEKWQIGYAPGNNALYQYLDSIPGSDGDLARSVAKELGMIRYNESRDSHYDFYRDRVMFPIHDLSGSIRGYSSRAVLPDQIPKYLNSGESFVFDKGSILFGLHFGKNAIRQSDQVILVEGNMDVIMMHQFGFHQTVGTMGTALSNQMVRILSNMTKNIYLALDTDQAGKKAMHKINAEFLSIGILPKFLDFAPHKDPDEFLVHEGRLALMERIEKAPIYLDVLIGELFSDKIPDSTDQKISLLRQVEELVSPMKENLSATERVINSAKILGMKSDATAIIENYKDYLSRQKEKVPTTFERPKLQEIEENIEQSLEEAQNLHTHIEGQVYLPPTNSERLFLREILCHPEFLTHLKLDEFLATIGHDEVKRLIQWLVKIYLEIDDAEYVSIVRDQLQYGGFSKSVVDIGTDALFHYGNRYNEKVIQKMLRDYLLMLKMDQLKLKRKALVAKQQSAGAQIEVDLILGEISKLDKEMLNLKNTVS